MKKLLLALILFYIPTLAFAQNNQRNPCYYLSSTSFNCIPVSATNPLPISGSISVITTATATIVAPSYTEGSSDPLSMDLSGNLRVGVASLPLPSGASTSALQTIINNTLGSPFQAGGSIGNSSFGISGTLPAYAATPTFNLGTIAGVATAANQILTQAPIAPATATATKSDLIGCQFNTTNLVFTNGQQGQVGCDQRGGIYVQDGQAIASVSVTSAATLFTITDTSGYGSISLQVTSAGTTCTITYETSEDGTTWVAVAGYTPLNTGSTTPVTTSTAVGQFIFPLVGKQFRARVSTYTSGTVTLQGTLRKDQLSREGIFIANTVSTNGLIAEGSAVGGNLNGFVIEARTSNKTAVSSAQYIRPIATTVGAQIVKPYQVPEADWQFAGASGGIVNTTTAVTLQAAQAGALRNYITSIDVATDTLGAATELVIRDGAAGTVIWRTKLQTASMPTMTVQFPTPLRGTAATLMEVVTLTASITGGVYVNAHGYAAP